MGKDQKLGTTEAYMQYVRIHLGKNSKIFDGTDFDSLYALCREEIFFSKFLISKGKNSESYRTIHKAFVYDRKKPGIDTLNLIRDFFDIPIKFTDFYKYEHDPEYKEYWIKNYELEKKYSVLSVKNRNLTLESEPVDKGIELLTEPLKDKVEDGDIISKEQSGEIKRDDYILELNRKMESNIQFLVEHIHGLPSKERELEILNLKNPKKNIEFYKSTASKQEEMLKIYNRNVIVTNYKLALSCLADRDPKKAEELAKKIIQNDNSFVFAHILIAELAIKNRQYDDALVAIDSALSYYPKHKDWMLLKADIFYLMGKFDDSLSICNEILSVVSIFFRPTSKDVFGIYYDDLSLFIGDIFDSEMKEYFFQRIYMLKVECLFNLKLIDKASDFIFDCCVNKNLSQEAHTYLWVKGCRLPNLKDNWDFLKNPRFW